MAAIIDYLKQREAKGLLRFLRPAVSRERGRIDIDGKKYVDFSSNDYLGLSQHPALKEISSQTAKRLGVGSCASRLLSGDLVITHELEKATAIFKNKEAALVFNSGYQLNVGVISALCGKDDAIFLDKLSHASIIDGCQLSGAKFFRFRHNDTEHLKGLLEVQRPNYKNSLIITESVFSMDGDIAPIRDIVGLKNRYNSMLMVDEAHATGIFGKNGAGLIEEQGLSLEVDIIMGTFSKALGGFGAYVACSEQMKQYLINACRSFIYSTALPPSLIAVNLLAVELIAKEPFRRRELIVNSAYLRESLKTRGFRVSGSTQIVPMIIGDTDRAVKISDELRERGYWALPIRPPTVPEGSARIRFCLTYDHTKEVIDKLLMDLGEIDNV